MMYLKAFLVGGVICALSQVLIDRTRLTPARILSAYVVLGVILTGVGLWGPLVEWAGCGATVPLLGFGYTMAEGVKKAVAESGLLGAFTGGLTATAGGISVGSLFLAGYLPAGVLALSLMIGSYIISVKRNYPKGQRPERSGNGRVDLFVQYQHQPHRRPAQAQQQ